MLKRSAVTAFALALLLCAAGCTLEDTLGDAHRGAVAEKPVIYLYPEEETEVSVILDVKGSIICTYPEYEDSWTVAATPDGTLTDKDGNEYSYLFWEAELEAEYPLDEGFVVKGEDTAAFLRDILSVMGLLPAESNDFITYWLPRMQGNPYNLITFQQEAYTEAAGLEISPQPDSMLRVFMVYRALEAPVEISEPAITEFERVGFTVVEWGGSEIK